MQATEKSNIPRLQDLFARLLEAVSENSNDPDKGHAIASGRAFRYLANEIEVDAKEAGYLAGLLASHAVRVINEKLAPRVTEAVEAVQIEWISNGILVRGKNSDGPFCNYYRDTTHLITNGIGACAVDFVKKKAPAAGDTCILYFGMSESASE